MGQQCTLRSLAPVADHRTCSLSRRLCHSATWDPSLTPPSPSPVFSPSLNLRLPKDRSEATRFSPPPPSLLLLWPSPCHFVEHLPGSLRWPDWSALHTAARTSSYRHGSARGLLLSPLNKSSPSPSPSPQYRQYCGRRPVTGMAVSFVIHTGTLVSVTKLTLKITQGGVGTDAAQAWLSCSRPLSRSRGAAVSACRGPRASGPRHTVRSEGLIPPTFPLLAPAWRHGLLPAQPNIHLSEQTLGGRW